MPRTCTICTHPERDAIDKALAVANNLREMSAKFRVSEDALSRHKAAHVPLLLAKAEETRQVEHAKDVVAHALDVVEQLKIINRSTLAILEEARTARDHDLALRAIDRVQRQIELQARLLGDLEPEGSVTINVNAELVQVLLAALAPFPEARQAAAQAILEVDDAAA